MVARFLLTASLGCFFSFYPVLLPAEVTGGLSTLSLGFSMSKVGGFGDVTRVQILAIGVGYLDSG